MKTNNHTLNATIAKARFVAENVMLESGIQHTPYFKMFEANKSFGLKFDGKSMSFINKDGVFCTIEVWNIYQSGDNQKYMVIEDHKGYRISLWAENGFQGKTPIRIEAEELQKAVNARRAKEKEELIKALNLAEQGVEMNYFYYTISAEWYSDYENGGNFLTYYLIDGEDIILSTTKRERIMLFFGF